MNKKELFYPRDLSLNIWMMGKLLYYLQMVMSQLKKRIVKNILQQITKDYAVYNNNPNWMTFPV